MRASLLIVLALAIQVSGVSPSLALEEPPAFVLEWGTFGYTHGQFDKPRGIAVDGTGNVYVTDASSRLQKFTSDGTWIKTWGSGGSADGQFAQPFGVTVDAAGNVYVADRYNSRIQKFTSDGVFLIKWGSNGTGDGQFREPMDVAVDSSGNVYVVELSNHRVQKFTSDGTFLAKWGSAGSGDGQFNQPMNLGIDGSDNIYIAELSGNRVQKFASDGTFLAKWGSAGSGDGQFNQPTGLVTTASGDVYVVDHLNARVQKFATSGTFLSKWGSPGSGDGAFNGPTDVAFHESGVLYVTDQYNHRIQKFDYSSGEDPPDFILQWGSSGSGDGHFSWPSGVALDPAGNVYVAEFDGYRVQKFDASGTFLTEWGSPGTGDGQFDRPFGITSDAAGNIYVADGDASNHRIQKFDANGTFLLKWGSFGGGDGQFSRPHDMDCDPSGDVYVADTNNSRIQKFSNTGTFITKWGGGGSGDGQFATPHGVACDDFGNVYVADTVNHRVQKFDGNGTFLRKWGSAGAADGQFSTPVGIACDAAGNVYVADQGNDRIQKFDPNGNFLAKWGTAGSAAGEFEFPWDVVCGSFGAFYVADTGNDRIQKLGPPPDTPVGTDIVVTPTDPGTGTSPAALTFDDITTAGYTELTIGASGFAPPTGFRLGIPPTYYDLSTTATFTGSIEVCIDFSTISFGRRNKVRLYHWEDNRWVNRTVSVDPDANIVCASVTSLSPFAVFELVDYVQAEPVGDCLSVENTCETVPVVFERDDATPARAVSVTFELSSELELCDAPGVSITQGSWLGSYDTAFEVVDEGGGIYTVDQAILGLPCGEVPGGALFEIDVQSTGTDGVGTITVTEVLVRDCANAPLPGDPGAVASITIDTAPPTAVADVATLQKKSGNGSDGTTEITVNFTAPGDADETFVYRKGYGDYPEYDDGTGAVPTVPVTPAAAVTDGWTLTPVTVTGEGDEPTNRDYWYYVIFTEDACDNVSAVSNMTSGTLNYHLGDVTPGGGDNEVDILDLTALGADYGKTLIHGDPVNDLDVGPTADYSVDALPDTDNEIQFEDLMMFAINHGDVTRSVPVVAELDRPELVLTSERHGDLLKTRLMLRNHTASVKGIRVEVGFDRSQLELVRHASGELLQTSTAFVETLDAEGGCFVDLAVFGSGRVLEGSGEVAELTFLVRERGSRPHVVSVDFRGPNNERMGDFLAHGENPALTVTIPQPVRLELLGARPNPFTNATEIVFTLPDSRQVTMNIFDVSGRLVRTITDATLPAGRHAAAWDGRDASGQATGAGIYFYTFQAGEHRETRKLLHVR